MTKKEESKELVPVNLSSYALANTDVNIGELVSNNIGGEAITFKDLERIQIPTGGGTFWTVKDANGDEGEVKSIEGVILMTKMIRSYWKEEYSGGGTPPDCSSEDCINGVGNPGGKCLECHYNQFKTKNDGKGHGKACAERRLVFLLTEGSLLPTVISVPPTSLDNAKKYLINLATKPPYVDKSHVVTSISLVRDKSRDNIDYSKVVFRTVGVLDDAAKKRVNEYLDGIMPTLDQAASAMSREGDGSASYEEAQPYTEPVNKLFDSQPDAAA